MVNICTLLAVLLSFSGPSWEQALPPAVDEIGVDAFAFDISQVSLGEGRWQDNQLRTLNYLLWMDPDRLLYNFRANHGLDTQGAQPFGGWDAPDFPFRTHAQGHFLSAWAFCYAVLDNDECRNKALYFAAELAKCQQNNDAAGFNPGYLSGFPESEIDRVEVRTLNNGNVPYYALHKTLAGLLDVYRHIGDETARDVMLDFAGWVERRTGNLSYDEMQAMLQTEFGGMSEVMADIYHQTGDDKWLDTARRFDHAAVLDPLAANKDQLSGLHANTQIPKWIGALRAYKATGEPRFLDIGSNAWAMTVHDHSYAIGGNSQGEHFRDPDAIADHLAHDTCELCNTYNMLKLTRELWALRPGDTAYFDFYERALLNHLLGAQDPRSEHGHITYFTPLEPGGRRGVGPVWGGGDWSTDDKSFWCCQSTALEINSKLVDSIYFHDNSTLFVNLFTPSSLHWSQKAATVSQTTSFPHSDKIDIHISASFSVFALAVRIPSWTSSSATVAVNGELVDVQVEPGTYARLERTWTTNDTVTVTLPMSVCTVPANDDETLAALAYGPVVLAGIYGDAQLSEPPTIELGTVEKLDGDGGLVFQAQAGGQLVSLEPFYDAHHVNYNVYWRLSGSLE